MFVGGVFRPRPPNRSVHHRCAHGERGPGATPVPESRLRRQLLLVPDDVPAAPSPSALRLLGAGEYATATTEAQEEAPEGKVRVPTSLFASIL